MAFFSVAAKQPWLASGTGTGLALASFLLVSDILFIFVFDPFGSSLFKFFSFYLLMFGLWWFLVTGHWMAGTAWDCRGLVMWMGKREGQEVARKAE